MALRVLLTGSEGSGKTSCIAALLPPLAADFRVLITDPEEPALWSGERCEPLLGPRWTRMHRRLRAGSKKMGLQTLFLIPNFLLRFLLARTFEATRRPEVSLYDADLLIHPVVYARYHFPFIRLLGPEIFLRVQRCLLGRAAPILIFHVHRPAAEAAARIEDRDDPNHSSVKRDLSRLAGEFRSVLSAARRIGYEVIRVDTAGRSPKQVALIVEQAIRIRLAP